MPDANQQSSTPDYIMGYSERPCEWRRSFDEWKEHPPAFAAFAWGEAMGRKP